MDYILLLRFIKRGLRFGNPLLDEMCGMGRTGRCFHIKDTKCGLQPRPGLWRAAGAFAATEAVAAAFEPGDHGTT